MTAAYRRYKYMDPWQEAGLGRQRKTIQSKNVSVSKISRKLYAYKCSKSVLCFV
jgi:hypothetical protein